MELSLECLGCHFFLPFSAHFYILNDSIDIEYHWFILMDVPRSLPHAIANMVP
jgi:hypothetical protein